jgi:hypothetical protein
MEDKVVLTDGDGAGAGFVFFPFLFVRFPGFVLGGLRETETFDG